MSMFGLDFIKRLKPSIFNYKNINYFGEGVDTEKKYLGFIAQDVAELLNPEEYTILKKDGGGFYKVDYLQLIAPAIKSIQELSDRIEILEKKLKEN